MEIHFLPFEGHFIVYRPLLPLAFVANAPLVDWIRQRLSGADIPADPETGAFLESVGFWEPDPAAPEPWSPGTEHHPATGVLLMTSACNLRCSYCYAHGGEGALRQMNVPLGTRIIDQVCNNAISRGLPEYALVFHGGGEPTANWNALEQLTRHALSKDIPCQISMATNGVMSKEKRAFVIEHFSGVSLSFDGLSQVQNAQRPTPGGGSSFDQVMETIRAFDEAGFAYGVRMTVRPENFATLPESVEFVCTETACQGIQVEPTYSGRRGSHVDPENEEAEQFIAAFRDAFEVASRHGRSFFYSGAMPWRMTSSFCKAGEEALIATPEGDLVTCFECHDRTHPMIEDFRIGSVETDDGSAAVRVDAERLTAFAEKERDEILECQDCHCYRHCAGDCAPRRAVGRRPERGRCQVNRELTTEMLAWHIASSGGVWRGQAEMTDTYYEYA